MKYIHKQTEVEAIKFTLTEAKKKDSLAFSQFGVNDRGVIPHQWSFWKDDDSYCVAGRFFIRGTEHGTMVVLIGDWLVKEPDTGVVTTMSEKRFNHLYRPALIKGPPPIDWAEEIRKAGIDLDKFRKQWNEEQIKILYGTAKPPNSYWGTYNGDWLNGAVIESDKSDKQESTTVWGNPGGPIFEEAKAMEVKVPPEWFDWMKDEQPSAMGAIMLEEHKKSEKAYLEQAKKLKEQAKRTIERSYADDLDAMMYGPIYNERKYLGKKKGEYHEDVHRIDSINPKTGPTDCCNRGTCEGCHDGES